MLVITITCRYTDRNFWVHYMKAILLLMGFVPTPTLDCNLRVNRRRSRQGDMPVIRILDAAPVIVLAVYIGKRHYKPDRC